MAQASSCCGKEASVPPHVQHRERLRHHFHGVEGVLEAFRVKACTRTSGIICAEVVLVAEVIGNTPPRR